MQFPRKLLKTVATVAAALAIVASVPASPDVGDARSKAKKLVVHEWGTFLSVQGSDGVTIGGMIDSEENLPPFVRERGLDGYSRGWMFYKMETPVTYFYVDEPMTVEMRVGMPRGLLTHWYPLVKGFGPAPAKKGQADVAPVNGFLDWGPIELIPAGPSIPAPGFQPVTKGNTWQFARETDAAFVRVTTKEPREKKKVFLEKFLFYRGLGAFGLPLAVRSAGAGDDVQLALQNRGSEPLQGVFTIRVAKDGIQYAHLADLAGQGLQQVATSAVLSPKRPLETGVPEAKQAVAAALVKAGLFAKEAQAMVNTWEKSYFRSEGLRVLYILPRSQVDEIIPLQVKPAPQAVERVMVGRIEVLTPTTEQRLTRVVANLGAADPAVKNAALAELTKLGRLQEPILRRLVAMNPAVEVKQQAESILRTIAAQP